MVKDDPVRFGAEFGPKRTGTSTGVSLSTFKTLVWVSNLGGLLLVVIGLELMMIQSRFYMALGCIVAGVIVAMFPSCLLYTSPSPRDMRRSRMPSSA